MYAIYLNEELFREPRTIYNGKEVENKNEEIKIVNCIEVVKKKLLVVKKLEEEIVEISDDTELLERIINVKYWTFTKCCE